MSTLDNLLAVGKTEDARAEAQSLLAKQPTNRDALTTLAKLALFDGELDAAESFIARAEKQGPTAGTSLLRANLAGQRGLLDTALAAYQQALALEPARAEAHFGRGLLLFKQGKVAPALEALQKAAQLDAGNVVFRYRLGQVQLEAGRSEEGLVSLRQALTLQPRFLPAYLSLSHVLVEREDRVGARRVLDQGLKALPNHPRLLAALTAVSLSLNDLKTSYQAASTLASQRPRDPAAQANLAVLLLARGQAPQALHLCRTMDSMGLANETLKMVEGSIFESEEPPQLDNALAAYEAAMSLAPDGWRGATNLGRLLLGMPATPPDQNVSRAVTVLEEAVRRGPEHPEPRLNLALAYVRAGKKDRARKEVQYLLAMPLPEEHPVRQEAERLKDALAAG
jgi:tetratricopeptide (TPR) repeat protein